MTSELKLPAASGGGSISLKGPSSAGSDTDFLDTSGNLKVTGTTTVDGTSTLTGDVTTSGDVNFTPTTSGRSMMWDKSRDALGFKDNCMAEFGNGNDLSIYHDGLNSYINESGTGVLCILGSEIQLTNAANTENLAVFKNDGACELFHDAVKVFSTVNGGFESGAMSTTGSTDGTRCHGGSGFQCSKLTTNFQYHARFYNPNGQVGYINTQNSATNYNTSGSDRDLKKNFESWDEDVLSLFKKVNPQKFNFKTEEDSVEKSKGFIAQEMVDSFPEAYAKNPAEGEDAKYYYNPSGMVVYLTKALQEAITKIETLETKVATLEAA